MKAVVTGPRQERNSVRLVLSKPNGESRTVTFQESLGVLPASIIIEILCMQERVFGDSRLEPPHIL